MKIYYNIKCYANKVPGTFADTDNRNRTLRRNGECRFEYYQTVRVTL